MALPRRPGSMSPAFRPIGAILVSIVLVMLTIGGTASLIIWANYQRTLEGHKRDMNSMGIVLAEQTSRYSHMIDLLLQEVQSRTASLHLSSPTDFQSRLSTQQVQGYLAGLLKNVPQADAIVLIDAGGQVSNSSRAWPVPLVSAVGRDYYDYFREHEDPAVFIGSLSRGRATGNLSLFFARRISGPRGEFFGLVLGVVDLKYLTDYYQTAAEHLGQTVTLLRRDGSMLMRYPDPAAAVGHRVPQESPWYGRVAEGGGSYASPGIDGVPSLVTVHVLNDYPLVVDIMMDEASVFANWYKETVSIGCFALAAGLAFSALFWVLARQFQRQVQQNDRLEDAAISLKENQEMLRDYAEMSADWFWEQDADFRFKRKTLIPFMMASDDTGRTRWELAGAAMGVERWVQHRADLDARLPFRNFCWERVGEDGARHFMTISGNPVFDRHGTFAGYRGTGREITAEVRARAQLAESNFELEQGRQHLNAVLENMTQGITLFDSDEKVLVFNRRFCEMYGLPTDQTRVGMSLAKILRLRQASGTLKNITPSDFLSRREDLCRPRTPYDLVDELPNDRTITVHYQPLLEGGWLTTHEDITDRRRAEGRLVFMARHDALTRLPNRVLFQERLEQALEMAGRGAGCAVLCLDLDRFKLVNDTLGHPVGDALLKVAAERLQACVREGDTVARLGGDEFAIIQLAVERPEDAELLASRIVNAFGAAFDIGGQSVLVGTSVGVAMAPSDGATPDKLLKSADIALYLAKTEGRSRVRFFEPEMDAGIQLRRMLELDLQGAMLRHELELYYQPVINIAADTVTGFEALLRWNHPVRGLVSPSDFIPLAEETGMIVAIGEWVLTTACVEAKKWPADISVAVNLSPVQFKRGELVGAVKAALAASGLQPSRLELEITESVLLQDTTGTLAALHQLRALGIGVALDDFGTGYSSLSYLRSFPFDKIKIDQSFVRDLIKDKEAMSIIRAVTGLGHSLRMKTTAEGVETREQLDKLRDEGCTEVQGYFFSRPQPAGELPALIKRLRRLSQSVI